MDEPSIKIPIGDPRHAAAMKVLDAMHEYFDLDPFAGAVRWIEDTSGRLIVFTRGEYRNSIMGVVSGQLCPTKEFEQAEREVERPGYKFDED